MKQEKKREALSGPLLDKPAVLLPKTGLFSRLCFYTMLLLLAGAGAMGCFFTAFDISPDPVPVIAMAAACALACSLQFLLPRRGFWLGLAATAGWAALVWYHFGDLAEAAKRVVNVVSAAYSEHLNFELPVFLNLGFIFPDRERYLFTLFAVLVQFPFFWFLSWMTVRHKTALGAFALTGLLLLFPLSFSILPAPWSLGALLLFWMFLLTSVPTLNQRRLLVEQEGRFQAAGVGFLRASSLALLPALALSLLLARAVCPQEDYERPRFANDVRSSFSQGFNLPALFRGGTGGGNQRVDLSSLGDRNFTGKTALRVKHSWNGETYGWSGKNAPGKDYLKSFVGSVYTGHSWEKLPEDQAEEVNLLLGEEKAQLSLARYAEQLEDPGIRPYVLSVERVDVSPRCAYLPYGLLTLPEGMAFVDDAFAEPQGSLLIPRTYEAEALALPDLDNMGPGSDVIYSEGSGEDASPNLDTFVFTGNAVGIPAYDSFVYEHYTQLPDGLREKLLEFLAGSPASDIPEILAEQCSYTLSPPRLPEGRDFVEHFLFESREGYCVHFATAAVSLYRALGIPARYAEGYAAPFTQNGEWEPVPDRNAHAWVELYSDSAGWIPVEVTPAGPDAPAAYADARAPEGQDATPSPSMEPASSQAAGSEVTPVPAPTPSGQDTAAPTPSPQAGPGGAGASQTGGSGSPPLFLLLIPAAVLLFLLAVWAARRLRLYWRKRAFSQRNRNRAALLAYAHILKLYRACAALPDADATPPEEVRQLALKARFSSHTLTEEEAGRFFSLAASLEEKLEKELPLPAKLKCKYLLALF